MTQRDMVANYMQDFGSISSWQAFADLGITRLSARIFELKERGFIISKQKVKTTNRYGKQVTYDKYWISGKVGAHESVS